jgi:Mn-dependent DtxR family transcriptional regulator
MIAHLRGRIATTDPVITEAVRELIEVGYLTAPDAETIELTAEGYDAIQRAHLDERREP